MDSSTRSDSKSEGQIDKFILTEPLNDGSSEETAMVIPIIAKRPNSSHEKDDAYFVNAVSTSTYDQKPISPVTRRSSVFTEDLPVEVELTFRRNGWTNRIVTDKQGNTLYSADIPWKWTGTKLDIYRGAPGEEQRVASLSRKPLNKRVFYHFPNQKQRVKIIGSKCFLGFDYFFEHDGRKYRWRDGHKSCDRKRRDEVLTDVETKEVIARFKNASMLEVWRKKHYGKLVIYNDTWKEDDRLLDLAVMTLVAVKQRIREKMRTRGLLKALFAAGDAAGNS